MFLLWKLTFQKPKSKILILFATGFSILGIILVISVWDSCGIRHLNILSDIENYEQMLDPEFCEEIVYRIDDFNEKCAPEIEILDCG